MRPAALGRPKSDAGPSVPGPQVIRRASGLPRSRDAEAEHAFLRAYLHGETQRCGEVGHIDPRQRIVRQQPERRSAGMVLKGAAQLQGRHRAAMSAGVDQNLVWQGG